ncbi:MAG: response regulator [Eubacteriaceae bacterium]
MIKVLIVDDQDIMSQGLKVLLEREDDLHIVDTAKNGREGYEKCIEHNPNVILMDMKMPILDGVEATKIIKRDFSHIKIIILTTFNDDEYIYDSLRYGASGYLLKDATPEEIAEGIRQVYNGGAMIQPKIALRVIEQFNKLIDNKESKVSSNLSDILTEREMKISELVAEGKNNKEIANIVFLSEGTVKNHITNILDKLKLRDRTQLAIYILKNK